MTTQATRTAKPRQIEALIGRDHELLKGLLKESLREVLEAEMTEAVGAGPGERTADRTGYRSGYSSRGLVTRIGPLELRVPRDRAGWCSTERFDRYQRAEKALVSALAERYVQGVSPRKVKAITAELCGHTCSASTVSRINTGLDELLRRFAQRRLEDASPDVILDARYEKVRLDGVIQSQAVFMARGMNWEGRRQVLGVELSTRESPSRWPTFVNGRQARGRQGVAFVVSDDHAGIKRAVRELRPEAVWQRCDVHFLRNALGYLPRKADDDGRQERRWLYDRRNLKEAQADLQAWRTRWESRYPQRTDWMEATIGETLNFYSLPRQPHKHLKSTNLRERLNEEIKRRTRVVRIFPNSASGVRLVRAVCAETHEGWLEDHRDLNMEFLKEQKKDVARLAA